VHALVKKTENYRSRFSVQQYTLKTEAGNVSGVYAVFVVLLITAALLHIKPVSAMIVSDTCHSIGRDKTDSCKSAMIHSDICRSTEQDKKYILQNR
jgi:hypothetical protein